MSSLRSAVIAVSLLAGFGPPASAQEDGSVAGETLDESGGSTAADEVDEEFQLLAEEEKVFSASKHEQKIGLSPAAVIVITRRDIEASGATTFMELMRRYPPVQVYMLSPVYESADVRGNYRVLLTLDGRETNLELFPQPFYDMLPVGLQDIDRIEIVLGPNSALYGANAVSAVVNVITRAPNPEPGVEVFAGAGGTGRAFAEARAEGGAGPWSFLVSAGADQSAFWTDPDAVAYRLARLRGEVALDLTSARLMLDGGATIGQGDILSLIGTLDYDRFVLGHLQFRSELGPLRLRAFWNLVRCGFGADLGLNYQGQTLGRIPHVSLDGDTAHLEAQADLHPWEGNLLILGADGRFTSYRSEQFVNPEVEEWRAGVLLHDEQTLAERWLLTLGARLDLNSRTDLAFSPQVAVVWNPADEHYLRLSYGTAFRKPTLLETSINFVIEPAPGFDDLRRLFEDRGLSNQNLGNESLTTFELGYRAWLLGKRLRLGGGAYFSMNRDWIEFAMDVRFSGVRLDLENSRIGYDNTGKDTHQAGVYAFVEGEPDRRISLFARAEYQQPWLVETGERLTRSTELTLALGGVLRLDFGLTASLTALATSSGEAAIRDPYSIMTPHLLMKTPAVFYLMAFLGYRIALRPGEEHLEIGIHWFNPFGGRFREFAGVTLDNGKNYGAEPLGSRVMFLMRLWL